MLDKVLIWYGEHRTLIASVLGCLLLVAYISVWQLGVLEKHKEFKDQHKILGVPRPKKHMLKDKYQVFAEILAKNVTSFTEAEMQFFMHFKESQYDERRENTKKFCVKP